MHRLAAALALVTLATSPVLAAPKKKAARAEFDKGVAAYTKGDYAAAADALGKSYALEADAETLFAWAQTERKLDRCDRAIDLYEKLLAMKLPEENKDAIRVQIEECRALLHVQTTDTPDATDPAPDITDDTPEPVVEREPSVRDDDPIRRPEGESRAWWKDPVGGALVGLGVVGVGLGTVFLVQGSSADADKEGAPNYEEYEMLEARAESRGRLGVISMAAGGALLLGGIVWYATHKQKPADNLVSGWLAPDGGGLVVNGRF